jgi:spore coat polysaccharide biosynthesis protein SpsF (cytidylyltransferase family)
MLKVVIGIQARTNNTRLPNKCRELIDGETMLSRVIRSAKKSANYVNNGPSDIKVTVLLLVPYGDSLKDDFKSFIPIVEGPEDDVLKRYAIGQEKTGCDYMVRITSDCPLIPPYLISKHIVNAIKYDYDYISNVNEETRTAPDGYDCEVIAASLLKWAQENANTKADREHVTTIIRRQAPEWAKLANCIGYTDEHHLKLSVDTQEDLDFVRTYHKILTRKIEVAKNSSEGFFRL